MENNVKTFYVLIVLVFVLFTGLINGCDNTTLPLAVVNEPDLISEPSLVYLEASVLYPASAPVGGEVLVRRGAGVFPTGFYRVTFSGGAVFEFFLPSSSSEVAITIPEGAISGPLGFTVGAAPADGTYYGAGYAGRFQAYAIKAPGLVVESDGSFSF